jgi:NAD dependent epimerase/dehydratase family enzyme
MIEPKYQGIYNLTAPTPATNLEFAQLLGKTLRRPMWLPVPAIALKAALGEAATLALDGRPVYPSRLLQAGYQFTYPDLEKGLQDLLTT